MAETGATGATAYTNQISLAYPLTKMNFLVTVTGVDGTAAFSEVSGVEATVDVIEFRQGNSNSLSPVKIPGLVKHGNVTLKFGYTADNSFKTWIQECVSETRGQMPRYNVQIEMIDINGGAPQAVATAVTGTVNLKKATAESLGLKKIGNYIVHEDNAVLAGKIKVISHLVKVENV